MTAGGLMANFKVDIHPKKFNDADWKIIKYYLEGHIGELHHFIKGQKIERLCLVLPMSVAEHGVQFNHCKNYPSPDRVPSEIQHRCLSFWKDLLSDGDFDYFMDRGMVLI